MRIALPLGDWDPAVALEKTNEDLRQGLNRMNHPVEEASFFKLESGLAQIFNLLIYVCSHGLAEHDSWSSCGGAGGYKLKKVR